MGAHSKSVERTRIGMSNEEIHRLVCESRHQHNQEKRARKREKAEERQRARDARTSDEQFLILDWRPGFSKRERAKLSVGQCPTEGDA